jgi:hypothetical protein
VIFPGSLIFLVPIEGSVPASNALDAQRLNQKRIKQQFRNSGLLKISNHPTLFPQLLHLA